MKKQTIRKPTRSSFTLLHQLCNLIPTHLVPQLDRDTGVAEKSRTFTPWSHVVSLIFAQLSLTRLFALLRSALWPQLELRSLLEVYGRAGIGGRFRGTPQQAFLAGFG